MNSAQRSALEGKADRVSRWEGTASSHHSSYSMQPYVRPANAYGIACNTVSLGLYQLKA